MNERGVLDAEIAHIKRCVALGEKTSHNAKAKKVPHHFIFPLLFTLCPLLFTLSPLLYLLIRLSDYLPTCRVVFTNEKW